MGTHTWSLLTPGVSALITLTVDSTVPSLDGSSFDEGFTDRYDLDVSQDIIISCGIESEYSDGEYGYFLPSETTIQFAVLGHDAYAMRYFRDAVKSVVISRAGEPVFCGNLDRKSVSYSFESRTLIAVFTPFIRPDRDIKANDGTVDAALFQQVFGVPYAQYDDGTVVGDWIQLRSALHALLRWFGAVGDIVEGDFNRYMTSVILQNRGEPIRSTSTHGASGWDGSVSLSQWLNSVEKNLTYNRLYIYKRILVQDGKYESVGASTLLDVIINLCREIGAVIGIAPDGNGFIYPAYMVRTPIYLAEDSVLSVSIEGYLEKVPAVVAAGSLYPLSSFGENSPGMSFIPDITTFGTVRYNQAGLHQAQYYSVSTLFTEDIDTGDAVKVCKFMHNPQQGSIPSGVGTDTFGYCATGTITPDGSLMAVKYMGTEDNWNTNGYGYWLVSDISSIISIGCWYYSLYRFDREQITLGLDGVDYLPYEIYVLPTRYGSIVIRPLSISINLTQNTTSLTGISVDESGLILPSGVVPGSGGETALEVRIIVISCGTAILTPGTTNIPDNRIPMWVTSLPCCVHCGVTFTPGAIYTDYIGNPMVGVSATAAWQINVNSSGIWRLWVKAEVIENFVPSFSNFLSLQVDGDTPDQFNVPILSGMVWQLITTKTLSLGPHQLVLRYVNPWMMYGVAAIYLTKDGETPNF